MSIVQLLALFSVTSVIEILGCWLILGARRCRLWSTRLIRRA
jgi:hypothetical protein